DHSFSDRCAYRSRSVRFDPRVVVMLAEIFMVRLEAERRLLAQEVLPSSTSNCVPFSAKTNSTATDTGPKGGRGFGRRPACDSDALRKSGSGAFAAKFVPFALIAIGA